MEIIDLAIKDVKLIRPKNFIDDRGYFSETFKLTAYEDLVNGRKFVQDNQSLSKNKYILRGLHYQTNPYAQDKLLQVLNGKILDIAVDIRESSETYGMHISKELSGEKLEQILVPVGFAHGFITLEKNTLVQYKVTNYYSPEHDRGIAWNDSDLAIDWGVKHSDIITSIKDQNNPSLADIEKFWGPN